MEICNYLLQKTLQLLIPRDSTVCHVSTCACAEDSRLQPDHRPGCSIHALRQARSRRVTSSILRVLSVIEIPGSMMYLFLIYVLS